MRLFVLNAHLSVGILDADVNSDHDENGDGDSKISNQTTDLMKETTYNNHIKIESPLKFSFQNKLHILQRQKWVLLFRGGSDQT